MLSMRKSGLLTLPSPFLRKGLVRASERQQVKEKKIRVKIKVQSRNPASPSPWESLVRYTRQQLGTHRHSASLRSPCSAPSLVRAPPCSPGEGAGGAHFVFSTGLLSGFPEGTSPCPPSVLPVPQDPGKRPSSQKSDWWRMWKVSPDKGRVGISNVQMWGLQDVDTSCQDCF